MDSINQNQTEQNIQDLNNDAAIAKIKELVEKTNTCFFCTGGNLSSRAATRPMSVQQVDEAGNLWFLSANDSHKNEEIIVNPYVQLYFQGSAHSDFLELYGTATISEDQDKIEELWEPMIKTWFTEGKDDPRISVIKFEPIEGYYWDTKHGVAVAGVKMMLGALLGKTMDDSIEGQLNP